MWICNLMLLLLSLPLVWIRVKLLTIPYNLLYPAILAFSDIGVFSINYNIVDVFSVSAFGLFGYLLSNFDCEPAPLLLGFILGPMLEDHFRRSMIISHGDPLIFVPISEERRVGKECFNTSTALWFPYHKKNKTT